MSGETLCPSAPAQEGALLIGVVAPDGRVARLGMPLTVDQAFLEKARARGSPEQQFRFSAPCQERGCMNWTGEACGLIGALHRAASTAGVLEQAGALPRCAIRGSCRWWRQRGPDACAVCPMVITDSRGQPGETAAV
jgi:hypothetical protein